MDNTVAENEKPGRRKEMNKIKMSRNVFMFAFLALPVLNFLVFYLYVNLDSFLMAFQRPKYDGTANAVRFSLANFETIINNFGLAGGKVMLEALRNTLMYYFAGMLIGLPISVLMCYFIYKKIACYKAFRVIIYLPNILSATALAVLFRYAVGTGGPVHAIVKACGGEFIYPFTDASKANGMLLFYALSFGFGGNLIIIGGAMNGLDPEMLEAAEIDGCNWIKELYYIIIPSVWPTVATIVVLSTASFLGATGPVLLFTKGSFGTMTLSYYIYALVSGIGGNQDLFLASAIGFLMTVVSFPIALTVKKFIYGKEDY